MKKIKIAFVLSLALIGGSVSSYDTSITDAASTNFIVDNFKPDSLVNYIHEADSRIESRIQNGENAYADFSLAGVVTDPSTISWDEAGYYSCELPLGGEMSFDISSLFAGDYVGNEVMNFSIDGVDYEILVTPSRKYESVFAIKSEHMNSYDEVKVNVSDYVDDIMSEGNRYMTTALEVGLVDMISDLAYEYAVKSYDYAGDISQYVEHYKFGKALCYNEHADSNSAKQLYGLSMSDSGTYVMANEHYAYPEVVYSDGVAKCSVNKYCDIEVKAEHDFSFDIIVNGEFVTNVKYPDLQEKVFDEGLMRSEAEEICFCSAIGQVIKKHINIAFSR